MSHDPFSSFSPSDSGLLEGLGPLPGHSPINSERDGDRFDYEAPAPSPVDAEAPEESLRDVPLPDGFLKRLRRFVDHL